MQQLAQRDETPAARAGRPLDPGRPGIAERADQSQHHRGRRLRPTAGEQCGRFSQCHASFCRCAGLTTVASSAAATAPAVRPGSTEVMTSVSASRGSRVSRSGHWPQRGRPYRSREATCRTLPHEAQASGRSKHRELHLRGLQEVSWCAAASRGAGWSAQGRRRPASVTALGW